MPNLSNRIDRLEGEMLPEPPKPNAVTHITSACSNYAGLAEAQERAKREGRPLLVINLVPAEFKHDKSENTPSAH